MTASAPGPMVAHQPDDPGVIEDEDLDLATLSPESIPSTRASG